MHSRLAIGMLIKLGFKNLMHSGCANYLMCCKAIVENIIAKHWMFKNLMHSRLKLMMFKNLMHSGSHCIFISNTLNNSNQMKLSIAKLMMFRLAKLMMFRNLMHTRLAKLGSL